MGLFAFTRFYATLIPLIDSAGIAAAFLAALVIQGATLAIMQRVEG